MSEETNKRLVIQLIEEVLNRENFALADQILSPDFASYFPANSQPMGREEMKGFIKAIHSAFPDMLHQIDELIAADDRIIARYTARGTHQGVYRGIPATGSPVVISLISIFRIQDGQIVEEYAEADLGGLMHRLGKASKTLEQT
jgi:steroid delta-isomerase-like uncharacterized protein